MLRKLAGLLLSVLAPASAIALAPGAPAAAPQIVDPALDHPVPFEDLVSVSLKVVTVKGRDMLETTFTLNGDVSDPSRNVMTGYNFSAKVGKCDLNLGWWAYPMVTEPAGLPRGSAFALCGKPGGTGKDVGGTFKYAGKTVIVTTPLQDLKAKGVERRAVMTNLKAATVPGQGLAGDDHGALALLGDSAAGTKPWTIS